MTFSALIGPRLTLRAMGPHDADALAARRSDPATAQYQSWDVPYPVDQAQSLMAEVAQLDGPTPGRWFQAAIVVTATGASVGDLAVHLSDDGHTAELGFTLDPDARGHGYATEAGRLMIAHLIDALGVHRIEAETDPRNTASARVLERLGLAPEGVRRENYWRGDTVSDSAYWGVLARDWRR